MTFSPTHASLPPHHSSGTSTPSGQSFNADCQQDSQGGFFTTICVSGTFSTPAGFVQTLYGPPNTCPITTQDINVIAVSPTNRCIRQNSASSLQYVCSGGGTSALFYSTPDCSGTPSNTVQLGSGCTVSDQNQGPTVSSCSSASPGYLQQNFYDTADCSSSRPAIRQAFTFTQCSFVSAGVWQRPSCISADSALLSQYNNAECTG